VKRLACRKPHRRDFPIQRFAADFSETDRAHQTFRNALPPRPGKKRNERAWRMHFKQPLIFQKTALPIHWQTGYNLSSVGFRRIPAKVFQGTPFR
jgi:hypothetical protein